MEITVEGAAGENALRTNEAEYHGGVEEDAGPGTSEVVCLAGLADTFYVVEGPFHYSQLDNAGPESADYLREEGYALGHLEIEAKFQVLQEEMGLIHCDVAICFEQHHCERPTRLHVSDDIFGEHVQSEMNIRRCVHDSDGNGPDEGDEESNDECPPREMGRPGTNSGETKCNHDEEKHAVPPIWDGLVFAHHLHVVVVQRALGSSGANPDLLSVKEEGVHKNCSDRGKCEAVRQ